MTDYYEDEAGVPLVMDGDGEPVDIDGEGVTAIVLGAFAGIACAAMSVYCPHGLLAGVLGAWIALNALYAVVGTLRIAFAVGSFMGAGVGLLALYAGISLCGGGA